jgi:sigma-B regulation protein RsbU (phosphoserine phosphatase)
VAPSAVVLLFLEQDVQTYKEFFRETLRTDALSVVLGLTITMLAIAAVVLFLLRRRSKFTAPRWFGIFALVYGARLLLQTQVVPITLGFNSTFLVSALTWIVPIPGFRYGYEVFPGWRGPIRLLLGLLTVVAVAGILADILTGRPFALHAVNDGLTVAIWLAVTTAIFLNKSLDETPSVLRWSLAVFGVTVIVANLGRFGLVLKANPEPIGFTVVLAALGYMLATRTLANEEHLRELNQELETATRIQASILPREMPKLDGLGVAAKYVPMTTVAGDFYDFLPIDDRRIGIVVADVAGHGVPAALIASMVKIAIAAQAHNASDPGLVMSGMNQALCGKLQGQYISAAYLFVDLEARIFRYAAGGHPPLLWWRAAERVSEQVEENGLLMGIMPRAPYKFTERAFGAGDRFLLYTDGLTEAANEKDEFFGYAGVTEALANAIGSTSAAFCDSLIASMERFSGRDRGRPSDDDLTLVVIDT